MLKQRKAAHAQGFVEPTAGGPGGRAGGERSVRCYHCSAALVVAARALTTMCPHCYRGLRLESVDVRKPISLPRIKTCGGVIVGRKGVLHTSTIEASGPVDVEGMLSGDVRSESAVRIGADARWIGDCSAPTLSVEPGATIGRGYFRIGDPSRLPRSTQGRAHPAAGVRTASGRAPTDRAA